MEIKQILIPGGLLAVAVVVWVYLKGGDAGADTQVSYPNANAGGLPQYQSPSVAYNFGARQPSPSPSLVRGSPPAIPPTPAYQKYNYSPMNIFSLSPEGAKQVVVMMGPKGGDCCCNDCGCDEGGPTFGDSNRRTKVTANLAEQAKGAPPALLENMMRNLATSVATDQSLAWEYFSKLTAAES